jgi:pSer/pThr/pTyr-binding forkhead associated (FHA) protein
MQVRLKILQGSNAGKELKIPAPKCVIGRGDDCHLRPQSDAISRRHCVIITTENEVVVRDLNSRNGTFVNGDRVAEEAVLLHGDNLRVGPLEFEMLIEQLPGSKGKRPRVTDIKDAVTRTAEHSNVNSTSDLGDVSQWLDEADSVDKQRRTFDPETRQFRLDETVLPVDGERAAAATSDTKPLAPDAKKDKEKKAAPGKLPPRPSLQKKDSREAAADMLKKFFNRR